MDKLEKLLKAGFVVKIWNLDVGGAFVGTGRMPHSLKPDIDTGSCAFITLQEAIDKLFDCAVLRGVL